MATKTYICPRWPSYAIGERVKFSEGLLVTDDPEAQAAVERCDAFGIHVYEAPAVPEAPPPASEPTVAEEPEAETFRPRVRQGRRGTV